MRDFVAASKMPNVDLITRFFQTSNDKENESAPDLVFVNPEKREAEKYKLSELRKQVEKSEIQRSNNSNE